MEKREWEIVEEEEKGDSGKEKKSSGCLRSHWEEEGEARGAAIGGKAEASPVGRALSTRSPGGCWAQKWAALSPPRPQRPSTPAAVARRPPRWETLARRRFPSRAHCSSLLFTGGRKKKPEGRRIRLNPTAPDPPYPFGRDSRWRLGPRRQFHFFLSLADWAEPEVVFGPRRKSDASAV